MYTIDFPKEKNDRQDVLGPRGLQSAGVSVPRTVARGMLLSQAFHNEASHRQDILSHLKELENVLDG
jgi:hypothetical protein